MAIGWVKSGTSTIEVIGTHSIDKYSKDFEAPAKVVGLSVSEITQTSFMLSWNCSFDYVVQIQSENRIITEKIVIE